MHVSRSFCSLTHSNGNTKTKDFTGKKAANEDDQKLLFGMLFSLKRFIERTSPLADDDGSFRHFTTSTYKLHQYYTMTGMRFVALSEPKVLISVPFSLFLNATEKFF
jgi:hypothetical protein